MKIKQLFSVTTILSLGLFLAGCVDGPGYYGGYRDYGPSYARYSGSHVVYRNGPRYRNRHYRGNRYYRSDHPRYDRRHVRSKNRDVKRIRNHKRVEGKPAWRGQDARRPIKRRMPENRNRRFPR